MAIVRMNRFTLLTFEPRKQALLKALQKFKKVHFKRLQKEDFDVSDIKHNTENTAEYENGLAQVAYAADKLKPFAGLPAGLAALRTPTTEMTFDELDYYTSNYDYAAICAAVLACDDKQKSLQAETARLKADNENLKQWLKLDVSLSEIDALKTVQYTIGAVNKNTAQAFLAGLESTRPNVYIETLQTVKDDVIFFIVAPSAEWEALSADLKNAGFTRTMPNFTGIPAEKMQANLERMDELDRASEEVRSELASYAEHYSRLKIPADYFQTALERAKACENFMNLADVLIIEGWAPQEESGRLKQILDTVCPNEYYLEETAVEKDSEDVPISLKNNRFVAAFEDVTSMYSLPKYNEIDPTPVLVPFYWLFFGLMVGDTGFGLVLLLGTADALKFFNLGKGTRNFITFLFYLSFSVILAGFLYGSAFGVAFFTPLKDANGEPKAILDAGKDIVTMIVLSIAIGAVQVLFGVAVKGYMLIRDGKFLDAVFDSLFWIIAVVSGIGLIVGATGMLPPLGMSIAKWGLIGSLIGLAATQGRSSPSLGGKIGSGLYAVYGISGYVGDLVSYTRIVALALSGAYIALSFNLMAAQIPNLFLRIVFGGLIVVLGQTMDLALGVLGAYVHTCRLQYVEFFGKFYEGGGVAFKPLSAKNNYVNLKDC